MPTTSETSEMNGELAFPAVLNICMVVPYIAITNRCFASAAYQLCHYMPPKTSTNGLQRRCYSGRLSNRRWKRRRLPSLISDSLRIIMFEREQVMHINKACSHIYRSRFTKHGGRRGCHECGVVEVVVSGSMALMRRVILSIECNPKPLRRWLARGVVNIKRHSNNDTVET